MTGVEELTANLGWRSCGVSTWLAFCRFNISGTTRGADSGVFQATTGLRGEGNDSRALVGVGAFAQIAQVRSWAGLRLSGDGFEDLNIAQFVRNETRDRPH